MSKYPGFFMKMKDEDKEIIKERAKSCSLSMSAFMIAASKGEKIKSTLDIDAVLEIGKVNADLARLGNLMKLTLDTAYDNYNKETIENINALIYELRSTQNKMRDIVLKV